MIARSHEEAISDPLTGLGNRRALAGDLERALAAAGVAHALVLFDLDGFKSYNDTFGHPAGDALLERSAAALAAAPHGGSAYRMGGDEFCLLTRLPDGDRRVLAREVAEVGAAALATRGEMFEVGSSYGAVVLPDEAATATDAIRLADQRMYARKGTGRRSGTRAAIDALLRAMQERGSGLGEHGTDVEGLADDLAAIVGLPPLEREHVRQAAALHDLGKLAIPDSILQKPGPLDEAELQFMRRHTEIGERILGEEPAVAPVGALVRASHEYWNGAGYPDGLAGAEIPWARGSSRSATRTTRWSRRGPTTTRSPRARRSTSYVAAPARSSIRSSWSRSSVCWSGGSPPATCPSAEPPDLSGSAGRSSPWRASSSRSGATARRPRSGRAPWPRRARRPPRIRPRRTARAPGGS